VESSVLLAELDACGAVTTLGIQSILRSEGNAFGQALLTGTFARRHFRGLGVETRRWLGAPNLYGGLHQSILFMIITCMKLTVARR
jgi:hypothetical protein